MLNLCKITVLMDIIITIFAILTTQILKNESDQVRNLNII